MSQKTDKVGFEVNYRASQNEEPIFSTVLNMKFNIIYTPNTVRHLGFFVHSLLEFTEYNFRLVSNGCGIREIRELNQLCNQSNRLTLWVLPTKKMRPHGEVLNYLRAKTKEKYFCFMDSDIFAVARLQNLTAQLKNVQGLFAGLPIWTNTLNAVLPNNFQRLDGAFNKTESGFCLGGTYFAVYDNRILNKIIESANIGFEARQWQDLPASCQSILQKAGHKYFMFDTGKVLNILLCLNGYSLRNIQLENLCHIGGFSFEQRQTEKKNEIRKIKELIKSTPYVQLLRAIYSRKFKKNNSPITNEELNWVTERALHFKNPVRKYFTNLYFALIHKSPLPERPVIRDKKINAQILKASENYISLFHKYIS